MVWLICTPLRMNVHGKYGRVESTLPIVVAIIFVRSVHIFIVGYVFCIYFAKMSINRDLHVELEEACRRSTLDRGKLGQKLRDFEALALERLTMVHHLEAQVRMVVAVVAITKPGCPCNFVRPVPTYTSTYSQVLSSCIANHEAHASLVSLFFALLSNSEFGCPVLSASPPRFFLYVPTTVDMHIPRST